MAMEAPPLVSIPMEETALDEDRILASLGRLREMHVSLCRLRETFSRVMDSVLVNPATPDLLHSNFSRAAIGAAQDIKSFTQLMEDGRSTEVIEMANESRAKNGEGIVGWKVTEYEDWLDVKKEDACGGTNVEKEALSMIEAGSGPGVEELRAGLDRFRQIHAGIEASLDEQSKTLKLHLPLPAQIQFDLRPQSTSEGHLNYSVDTKEKSSLHRSILSAISASPRASDLQYLLEMLASYSDIKSKPCAKCARLLDRNAQFPVLRTSRQTKQLDNRYTNEWQALHKACA